MLYRGLFAKARSSHIKILSSVAPKFCLSYYRPMVAASPTSSTARAPGGTKVTEIIKMVVVGDMEDRVDREEG
jgi:hypothetical protein